MISRTLRKLCQMKIRVHLQSVSGVGKPIDPTFECKQVAVHFLNLVFGNSESGDLFWRDLNEYMLVYFPMSISAFERTTSLKSQISLFRLALRFQELTQIFINFSKIEAFLFEDQDHAVFSLEDIKSYDLFSRLLNFNVYVIDYIHVSETSILIKKSKGSFIWFLNPSILIL